MYRDASAVLATMDAGEDACAVVHDDKTIYTYSDSSGIDKYTLMGDKYVHVKHITSDPSLGAQPTGSVCINTDDVMQLPSSYEFMTPIYSTIAIMSALLIFYAGYRLIIYPFFRKR